MTAKNGVCPYLPGSTILPGYNGAKDFFIKNEWHLNFLSWKVIPDRQWGMVI